MEILRALATLCESPGPESVRLADLLELGEPPAETDWSDLFLFQLSPYASVYLGVDGRIGGEARDRIAGFWRALRLEPPRECDHLAVMLAFHAELGERETAAASDEAERWRHVRRAFLWEHLLSWLPPFLTRVEEVGSPFFRAWSRLVGETLAAEAESLPRPEQPPMHFRLAPALADPRDAGSRAFLESLLTPMASGMIFSRRDLERAGRELGLALRIGERRFLLETLLSQASGPVLGWLAAECDGWRARLEEPRRDGLPAGDHWRERAGASAELLAELSGEVD